jgi:hypothetical protein
MFRATQPGGSVVQSEKRAWHTHTSYRYDRGPWRREHFRWHAKSATAPLPLSTIDNVRRSAGEGAPRASSFPLRQDGLQHSASKHAAVRHPKSSAKLCYVPPPIDQNHLCCLSIDRGVESFCIRALHIRVVEQSPCRTRFTCGPLWSARCHTRIGECTKGDAP